MVSDGRPAGGVELLDEAVDTVGVLVIAESLALQRAGVDLDVVGAIGDVDVYHRCVNEHTVVAENLTGIFLGENYGADLTVPSDGVGLLLL